MAEFDVTCEQCGKTLESEFITIGRNISLEVYPCGTCLENAEDVGYEKRESEE